MREKHLMEKNVFTKSAKWKITKGSETDQSVTVLHAHQAAKMLNSVIAKTAFWVAGMCTSAKIAILLRVRPVQEQFPDDIHDVLIGCGDQAFR